MILITGATGHLGVNLTARLLDLSLPLRLLVRNPQKVRKLSSMLPADRSLDGCEQVVGDIRDLNVLKRALSGISQVVHCCHSHDYWSGPSHVYDVNVGGAKALIQALRNRTVVERIVFLGSYSAHALYPEEPLDRPTPGTSARECSSVSKRLAQAVLTEASRAMGFDLRIVSPSYMIGPYQLDPTYFGALFHWLRFGPLRLSPPNGINVVDVRDVADAVSRCLTANDSRNGRILATGGNVSLQTFFEEMNHAAGFGVKPRRIPRTLCSFTPHFKQFGSFGRSYFLKDHYVSQRSDLPSQRFSLRQSVEDTVQWAQRFPLFQSRREFWSWIRNRYFA